LNIFTEWEREGIMGLIRYLIGEFDGEKEISNCYKSVKDEANSGRPVTVAGKTYVTKVMQGNN
jgi:hypothetical protein